MTVKQLEEIQLEDSKEWELYTNSGDITDIILGWELGDKVELSEIGCLFVRWCDEDDPDQIWYCESNIPYHHKQVWRLK